jgi:hypothetical protein
MNNGINSLRLLPQDELHVINAKRVHGLGTNLRNIASAPVNDNSISTAQLGFLSVQAYQCSQSIDLTTSLDCSLQLCKCGLRHAPQTPSVQWYLWLLHNIRFKSSEHYMFCLDSRILRSPDKEEYSSLEIKVKIWIYCLFIKLDTCFHSWICFAIAR